MAKRIEQEIIFYNCSGKRKPLTNSPPSRHILSPNSLQTVLEESGAFKLVGPDKPFQVNVTLDPGLLVPQSTRRLADKNNMLSGFGFELNPRGDKSRVDSYQKQYPKRDVMTIITLAVNRAFLYGLRHLFEENPYLDPEFTERLSCNFAETFMRKIQLREIDPVVYPARALFEVYRRDSPPTPPINPSPWSRRYCRLGSAG